MILVLQTSDTFEIIPKPPTRQYAIRGQVGGDHGGVAPLGQSVLPAELPRHELVVRLLLVLGLHAQRVAHHAHLSRRPI